MDTFNAHEDLNALLHDIWHILPKREREETVRVVYGIYLTAYEDHLNEGKTPDDAHMLAFAELASQGYTREKFIQQHRPIWLMGFPITVALLGSLAMGVLLWVTNGRTEQLVQLQGTFLYLVFDWCFPLIVVVPTMFTCRVYARLLNDYLLYNVPTMPLVLLGSGLVLSLAVPWYAQRLYLLNGQALTVVCQLGLFLSCLGALGVTPHLKQLSTTLVLDAILATACLIVGFIFAVRMPLSSYINAFALGTAFNVLVCVTLCIEMLAISLRPSLRLAR